MDKEAWWATIHGVARVRHDLATKLQQMYNFNHLCGDVMSYRDFNLHFYDN